MNIQFVPHKEHVTSPLQSPAGKQSLFIVRTVGTQDTLCGQNAEFLNLETGSSYSDYFSSRIKILKWNPTLFKRTITSHI
jgi:hypothetical protein